MTTDDDDPLDAPDSQARLKFAESARRTTRPSARWTSGKIGAGRRVLAVDDDPAVRRVVERALRDAGFEVSTACNGAEALDRLRAENQGISAVVLDVGMPSMNGYQFRLRQLADPAIAHVPVVVLSAEAMHDSMQHMRASACVCKPFLRGELVEAVLDAIQSAPVENEERAKKE